MRIVRRSGHAPLTFELRAAEAKGGSLPRAHALNARGQDVFNGADRIIECEVAGKTGSRQRRGADLAARPCRAQSVNLVAAGAVDFHFNFVGIEAVNSHGINFGQHGSLGCQR